MEAPMNRAWAALSLALILWIGFACSPADSACCYFAAKDKDILQPAQKAFLTWDPVEKVETFTVQPRFEGNAVDFGMVIPTPTQPKLHEMPRDFFKHLAVYTIMKKREFPHSKLLPLLEPQPNVDFAVPGVLPVAQQALSARDDKAASVVYRQPAIKILEV